VRAGGASTPIRLSANVWIAALENAGYVSDGWNSAVCRGSAGERLHHGNQPPVRRHRAGSGLGPAPPLVIAQAFGPR